jgi:hypothetical protein
MHLCIHIANARFPVPNGAVLTSQRISHEDVYQGHEVTNFNVLSLSTQDFSDSVDLDRWDLPNMPNEALVENTGR